MYYLRTVEDGIRLKHAVRAESKGRAVIVGGGFIGLEVAEEMALSGVEVHIYEMMPRLLPFLEESFSEEVLRTLENHGVHVHLGTGVQEILTDGKTASGVRDGNGQEIQVDLILMSIGVMPNSELA